MGPAGGSMATADAPHLSISSDEFRKFKDDELRDLARELDGDEHFDPMDYTPPGPVGEAFLNAVEPTSVIMGPIGGGKTTLCAFRRLLLASYAPICWHPETRQPTRMCKAIILRDTFRNLERTVLKSWQNWFSKKFPGSTWTGGNDRPATHILRFRGEDGIAIEAITEFSGLNDLDLESLLKGSEYSIIWLNEVDTHADNALDEVEGRVGRYPMPSIMLTQEELKDLSLKLKRPIVSEQRRLAVVMGDMNAPTIDNWTYKGLLTDVKPGRKLYQQPSGRSPEAENLMRLPPGYYEHLEATHDEAYIKRNIDNQFGYSRAGKPVFPTFRHERHVASAPIKFIPDSPLLIGIDVSTNALTPAAALGQVQPNGRIALIDELIVDHGYGPARFGEALKRKLDERYYNRTRARAWADPASQYGGDREGGQLAAMEILGVILGFPLEIPFGGSNELALRLDAVNVELRGYTDADTSLIISPTCTGTIQAFAGRYRFKKLAATSSNEYDDQPEKSHPWSDIMDGVQYLVGGLRGRTATVKALTAGTKLAGESRGWGDRSSARAKGGFDPHAF